MSILEQEGEKRRLQPAEGLAPSCSEDNRTQVMSTDTGLSVAGRPWVHDREKEGCDSSCRLKAGELPRWGERVE